MISGFERWLDAVWVRVSVGFLAIAVFILIGLARLYAGLPTAAYLSLIALMLSVFAVTLLAPRERSPHAAQRRLARGPRSLQ